MGLIMTRKDNDQQWLAIAAELDAIIAQRKEASVKEKELMAKLIEISDKQEAWGGDYRLQVIISKGSIDYKAVVAIEIDKDIDLEFYRKKERTSYTFKKLLG